MIPIEWIENASDRLHGIIHRTPLTYHENIALYLKWENHQVTGSFKVRGALNKILSLQEWELQKGLVTCSAGNHGQGVALGAQNAGAKCFVFASAHASLMKIEAMQTLGAEIRLVKGEYFEAERTAKEYAVEKGLIFISPYNDGQVIAGQGTIGLELIDQLKDFSNIPNLLVPVGGGGLICGLGAALEGLTNRPRLIGVQSESSPYAYNVFKHGTQESIVEAESVADGLAGEIDHDSITIPLIQKYVDDIILVTEAEIYTAIRFAWFELKEKIEGSAAVGLAARLAGKIEPSPAICIVTGGNIQPELFESIVA